MPILLAAFGAMRSGEISALQKFLKLPTDTVNMNPNTLTTLFGNLLKKLEIPHFRFHDLRHYNASVQHALGIPDAYIMQSGG